MRSFIDLNLEFVAPVGFTSMLNGVVLHVKSHFKDWWSEPRTHAAHNDHIFLFIFYNTVQGLVSSSVIKDCTQSSEDVLPLLCILTLQCRDCSRELIPVEKRFQIV